MKNPIIECAELGKQDYEHFAEGRQRCLDAGGCPECFCVPAEQGREHWVHCSKYKKENEMLNAKDAASLYVEPPLTEEEIENHIRDAATRGNCTVFDKLQLADEMLDKLLDAGYKVSLAGVQYFVTWEQEAA